MILIKNILNENNKISFINFGEEDNLESEVRSVYKSIQTTIEN